ncbi:MAG: hypothetical protein AB3N14_03175 [Flavobacteriaceae bacterium]
MNKKLKITGFLLGCYLVVLPILMAVHVVHHSREYPLTHEAQEVTLIPNKAACEICTYYFTQQLHLQSRDGTFLNDFDSCFYQEITETVFTNSLQQLCLRGPPPILAS